MRKIVVSLSVSLDGFFEGPDGDLGWHLVDDELHSYFNDELRATSAFLSGRVNHELMAGYWPTADADPASPAPVVEFARIWRDKPKYVWSTTLQHADWNTTIVREVDRDDVLGLKDQPGGDMVLGGAKLAASFQAQGLIDEYRLFVHPVVIGSGRPLFPPGAAIDLALQETKTFSNGVVMMRYGCR